MARFQMFLVLSVFAAVVGTLALVAGSDNSTGTWELNTGGVLGLLVLAVSGLVAQFAICGIAVLYALDAHADARHRPADRS